jgi:hypothetical protein
MAPKKAKAMTGRTLLSDRCGMFLLTRSQMV